MLHFSWMIQSNSFFVYLISCQLPSCITRWILHRIWQKYSGHFCCRHWRGIHPCKPVALLASPVTRTWGALPQCKISVDRKAKKLPFQGCYDSLFLCSIPFIHPVLCHSFGSSAWGHASTTETAAHLWPQEIRKRYWENFIFLFYILPSTTASIQGDKPQKSLCSLYCYFIHFPFLVKKQLNFIKLLYTEANIL